VKDQHIAKHIVPKFVVATSWCFRY